MPIASLTGEFTLEAQFQPTGDQPEAIAALIHGLERGDKWQTRYLRQPAEQHEQLVPIWNSGTLRLTA